MKAVQQSHSTGLPAQSSKVKEVLSTAASTHTDWVSLHGSSYLNESDLHQDQQAIDKLNALIFPGWPESDLEMFNRLSADRSIHVLWTDEFLESLPPRSEAESLALQQIRF